MHHRGKTKLTESEVARHWNRIASRWAHEVRNRKDTYREFFNNPEFFKFIGQVGGKRVLDMGCGEGYSTRMLARSGAKVIGIDISRRMIELARREERRRPLGIRYEVGSFSDLSIFPDKSFDAVVSFMALMDSPNLDRALREAFRVIRKGGDFFFNITHPCFVTRGYGWLKDEKGNCGKSMVSNYFSNLPWVDIWTFADSCTAPDGGRFSTPFFPRTLSEYLNGLISAGFEPRRIHEPRPTSKLCR